MEDNNSGLIDSGMEYDYIRELSTYKLILKLCPSLDLFPQIYQLYEEEDDCKRRYVVVIEEYATEGLLEDFLAVHDMKSMRSSSPVSYYRSCHQVALNNYPPVLNCGFDVCQRLSLSIRLLLIVYCMRTMLKKQQCDLFGGNILITREDEEKVMATYHLEYPKDDDDEEGEEDNGEKGEEERKEESGHDSSQGRGRSQQPQHQPSMDRKKQQKNKKTAADAIVLTILTYGYQPIVTDFGKCTNYNEETYLDGQNDNQHHRGDECWWMNDAAIVLHLTEGLPPIGIEDWSAVYSTKALFGRIIKYHDLLQQAMIVADVAAAAALAKKDKEMDKENDKGATTAAAAVASIGGGSATEAPAAAALVGWITSMFISSVPASEGSLSSSSCK